MATDIILRGPVQRAFAISTIEKLSPDKIWHIVIKPWKKPRTLDQNALFHGWCAIIARETGNDPGDVKYTLKDMFLPKKFIELNGETREVRPETSKLKVGEMAEFCTRIQAWAATEFGIVLPTRDDFREDAS